LLISPDGGAQGILKVDESKITILLAREPAEVRLAIENLSQEELRAMSKSDWSIGQYDVLPDRVVVYLWPKAGGSEFTFKFRPRMAMTAKAAASSIYDYYNPDAKAVVAPGTFVIR
jgi:hypothetical protein